MDCSALLKIEINTRSGFSPLKGVLRLSEKPFSLGPRDVCAEYAVKRPVMDIFTGVTCYPLQSHLRTSVLGLGQVETDEIYIGLDRRGAHHVFPVQAKGENDLLNIVQIEQDVAMCRHKFPNLICRPIAAQFMRDDLIVLFEFEHGDDGTVISTEKHYRLVPPEDVEEKDVIAYRARGTDGPFQLGTAL